MIEATGTYRWLYDLLSPLRHDPFGPSASLVRHDTTPHEDRQAGRPIVGEPAADQPDSAGLHSAGAISAVARPGTMPGRLGRDLAEAKIHLRALLARQNREAPFRVPFGVRGLAWFRRQDFGPIENLVRDELLARMRHFGRQIDDSRSALGPDGTKLSADGSLAGHLRHRFVLGAVDRGRTGRGGTLPHSKTGRRVCRPRLRAIHQSGGHCYQGSITRQGSPWLRWILVQAAMKAIRDDAALKNFYTRVRKRSSAKIARVAVARKLAEICWKRCGVGNERAAKPHRRTLIRAPARPPLARKRDWWDNVPRATDWALRPVNNILCDGREPGRHEWVSTMCARRKTYGANKTRWNAQSGAGVHARTFRRIHSADQGRSLPPPGPQASLSPFRCCYDLRKSEIRALTQRRLWVSPFPR